MCEIDKKKRVLNYLDAEILSLQEKLIRDYDEAELVDLQIKHKRQYYIDLYEKANDLERG